MKMTLQILAAFSVLACITIGRLGANQNKKQVTITATLDEFSRTNVTSGDNHQGCSTCEGIRKNYWAIYHPPHGAAEFVAATERWTTTTVEQVKSIAFEWDGEPVTKEKILSSVSTTKREKLNQEWSAAGETIVTNDLSPRIMTFTNRMFIVTNFLK